MQLQFRRIFAGACVILSFYFFLWPAFYLSKELSDPDIRSGKIPSFAWSLSKRLAPKYESWARDRIKMGHNPATVSGTEWPLFGSVFYLSALESLQQAWENDPTLSTKAPVVYSRGAIEAAADLVADPNQAQWVQQYWGKNYLHHADLFYRYLLISSMTSYTNLTGNQRYALQLRDQVDTLSAEIDESPLGLLDDYPNQCYPTDVMSALVAIKRADKVLHSDHSTFLQRALRGFIKPISDCHGIPPYAVISQSGVILQSSRGCGNSFAFTSTSSLWPEPSAAWYQSYTKNFWQRKYGLVGFREFARDTPEESEFMDVDSGPVIWNFGVAASAFGVGTTRSQGDLVRAAPLTAEMLVTSWPLPGGMLLFPRLFSDASDAPYVGEAGILYCLTRPVPTDTPSAPTSMTPFVWLVLMFYFGFGLFLFLPCVVLIREKFLLAKRLRSSYPS